MSFYSPADVEKLRRALAENDVPDGLIEEAGALRDRGFGRVVTYSRKAFLPVTNLCRDRCSYCTFRKDPDDPGAWTMRPEELESVLDRARAQGCKEALMCLGDRPETAFPIYRETLAGLGFRSTVDYVYRACRMAIERGLLPHTNMGILTRDEMIRLRDVNASLGLMLETVSERLRGPGMPHHRAPDKAPRVRLRMLREAGELRIPFTTGILIGIGETWDERIDSLLAIRDIHAEYGHIQEVIVQNYAPKPELLRAPASGPGDLAVAVTVAAARCILGPAMSIQVPPNLNPGATSRLLNAGINDFGGISPVTQDYINPEAPWPHLDALATECKEAGFALRERLAVYPRYIEEPGFLADGLRGLTKTLSEAVA
ncbi:MAG: 7,8-didemethyl-8-hydroxy-5-deazariboflavin synthase CofG [Polyangiaceae bacterium]|nr:7,8-didemethyl-8-hydroxy-5-deazariboflavin synthase CofG [Polyangiaceae bacterium]